MHPKAMETGAFTVAYIVNRHRAETAISVWPDVW